MRQERGQASIPRCPFCSAELRRPEETEGAGETHPTGACTCGAVYYVDPTGKNVGTLMAHALVVAADALGKKVSELDPEQDYRDAVLSYDWRTHRSAGEVQGYLDGYGRMYIIKTTKRTA
jgi:hypothetical protein